MRKEEGEEYQPRLKNQGSADPADSTLLGSLPRVTGEAGQWSDEQKNQQQLPSG